jgi:hypothetical protein
VYKKVWESGLGLSGAGSLEIDLLSQRAIEPGKPGIRKEVLALSEKPLVTAIDALPR